MIISAQLLEIQAADVSNVMFRGAAMLSVALFGAVHVWCILKFDGNYRIHLSVVLAFSISMFLALLNRELGSNTPASTDFITSSLLALLISSGSFIYRLVRDAEIAHKNTLVEVQKALEGDE